MMIMNHLLLMLVVLWSPVWAGGCSKSSLGPDISDKDKDSGSSSSGSDDDDDDDDSNTSSSSDDDDDDDSSSSTSIACSLTSGHYVYYVNSTVSMTFTCDSTVSSYTATSKPSYLTGSSSSSTITYSGTAPSSATSGTWSVEVNGETTTGAISSISNSILATTSLSLTNGATAMDPTTYNASAQTLTYGTVSMASTYDGSGVTNEIIPYTSYGADTPAAHNGRTFATTDSDITGLVYYASCSSGSTYYICPHTSSFSSNVVTGQFKMHWQFGAFDQGDYFLKLRSNLVADSANIALAGRTYTYTIAAQTGSVSVTSASTTNSATYNRQNYPYAIAISRATSGDSTSTAKVPVVGLLYFANDGVNSAYFRRASIDRTLATASAATAVGESNELKQLTAGNSANTLYWSMKALDGSSWVAAGAKATAGTGADDIWFNVIDDDATTPTLSATTQNVAITVYSAASDASYVDLTQPFTDADTQTRLGMVYIRATATDKYVSVVKLDPTGTNKATVIDDADYDTQTSGDAASYEIQLSDADRTKIQYSSESGTGYFYIAYRNGTEIDVTKLRANKSSGSYGATTASLTSDLATDPFAAAGSSNDQTLNMAIGAYSGSPLVGVVWREADANNGSAPDCYFRRFNSTLTTKGDALKLSAGTCYWPNIHYNSTTGRFIVTFLESVGGNYRITSREVTIGSGSTDTASTAMVVVQLSTTRLVKLVTDFYPTGSWVGIWYRLLGTTGSQDPMFHGYHVSGQ